MSTSMAGSTGSSETWDWTGRRLALLAGPTAAIVLVGGILLAAYVFTPTPSFDWMGELEQFGVLRHYSIAIGCLLGLIFLWPVWTDAVNTFQRLAVGLFGLGFVITGGANAMAAAGVRAGDWAIVGLLLLFPLTLLLYGSGDVSAEARQRGGKSLLLGVAYLLILGLLFAVYQLVSYVGAFVVLPAWAVAMYPERG